MIIRSIRNFGKIYDQVANIVSDTEELIRNRSALDFENDDCEVELVKNFPEEIFLRASLHPVAIDKVTKLTRTDSERNFVIENIYDSKFLHSDSEVKNHLCKSISILYESTGYYMKNDQHFDFSDRHFENFELNFNDELFRMDFQICDKNFLYEQIENLKIILGPNEKYSTVFYPCGGFYFYGCHPKHIEPCLCCAQFEQKDLRIKSYSIVRKNQKWRSKNQGKKSRRNYFQKHCGF